jgi:hypothetical protein
MFRCKALNYPRYCLIGQIDVPLISLRLHRSKMRIPLSGISRGLGSAGKVQFIQNFGNVCVNRRHVR